MRVLDVVDQGESQNRALNMNEQVFIGLGSNVDHPEYGTPQQQLVSAVQAIADDPAVFDIEMSSLYSSSPMGPKNQPDYINAVAHLRCNCSADELLDKLQRIEQEFGRVRKSERWGPRTLDLDILLFDQQIIQSKRLTIPHYGMTEREFVLVPLFELAPDMVMPDGRPLAAWVSKCSFKGLRRLRSETQIEETQT